MTSSQFKNSLQREEEKLVACVHCGLCLEACPTYVITGNENDGPRGRLYLMRAVADGRLPNTSTSFSTHIDRCLGCRACEPVCPAGVEYGQLLEVSRHELLSTQPKQDFTHKLLRFALNKIWKSKSRLQVFFLASRIFRDTRLARLCLKLGLAKVVSSRANFALALLESSRGQVVCGDDVDRLPISPKTEPNVGSVMLFKGCVGEGLFSRVNQATTRVLEVNGFVVQSPSAQVCCGALHAHAGDLEGARRLARQNIAAFSSSDAPVITNAGGCGAMLCSYGHLLNDDNAVQFSARVRDVGQLLETVEMKHGAGIEQDKTTYDISCHLQNGQRAGAASLKMLKAIPNLDFHSLEGAERCCGGAGIYNLLEPELSRRVLDEKLRNIEETRATVLATGNPGCQMQIGAGACLKGMNLRVCHPVELLDESYRRAGFYSEMSD